MHGGLWNLRQSVNKRFLPVKTNMVRLLLFDIDGTLIRTGGAGMRAFARTAERTFGRPGGTDGVCFAGRTDTALIREFFRAYGVPVTAENEARFIEAYLGNLEEFLGENAGEICPGVEAFLERVQSLEDAPTLGLLTGNVRRGAELKLRAHGLWELFQFGGFGEDHEDRSLVAAAAVERARMHLGLGEALRGEAMIVIGDTPRDVSCAQAVGAMSLAVTTGGFSREELERSGATWVVENLGEAGLTWMGNVNYK